MADDEYIVVGGDHARRTASFRLGGDRLDPDAVTRATGLVAKRAHRKGDPRPLRDGSNGRWRNGLWSIDTSGDLPDDVGLDEHLGWLLDQLEPCAESLMLMMAQQDLVADFFCGYFMEGWNNGFLLSAGILARIAALGADLGFDIYGPE